MAAKHKTTKLTNDHAITMSKVYNKSDAFSTLMDNPLFALNITLSFHLKWIYASTHESGPQQLHRNICLRQ